MVTQRKRRRTSVRNTDGSLTCPVCPSRTACLCCSSCRRAAGRSCCPPPILKGKERGELYQELQLLGSAGYPVPLGVRRMRRQQRQDHAHRRPLQCGRAQKPLSPARQLPMLPTTSSPCDTHTSTVTPTPAPPASLTHPNATLRSALILLVALAPCNPCRGPRGPYAVPYGPLYLAAQDTLSPLSKHIPILLLIPGQLPQSLYPSLTQIHSRGDQGQSLPMHRPSVAP